MTVIRLLLAFLVLSFPCAVVAAVLYVPSEYATIQAGIDAASDGDTVVVAPGVYTGEGNRDIEFGGKLLVVRSSGGREVTTIDCQGSEEEPHRAFDFYASHEPVGAVVEGFTMVNGYAHGPTFDDRQGGAIRMLGTSVSIRSCAIANCFSSAGGSAAIYGGVALNSSLEDCLVTGCGSFAVNAPNIGRITGCSIVNNGRLALRLGTFSEVTDCIVAANDGDGVEVLGSDGLISDSVIAGNVGNGLLLTLNDGLELRNCTIVDNGLAGIYMESNWLVELRHSVLRANCAWDLFMLPNEDTIIIDCCAYDPSSWNGNGTRIFQNGTIEEDPLFCGPSSCQVAPTSSGDYRLALDSPCLPENNSCGVQIGARGPGCASATIEGFATSPERSLTGFYSAARSGVILWAQLGEDGFASVDLVDVSGRVLHRADVTLQGGEGFLALPDDVAGGVYFLRLVAGGEAVSTRVVVAR